MLTAATVVAFLRAEAPLVACFTVMQAVAFDLDLGHEA